MKELSTYRDELIVFLSEFTGNEIKLLHPRIEQGLKNSSAYSAVIYAYEKVEHPLLQRQGKLLGEDLNLNILGGFYEGQIEK